MRTVRRSEGKLAVVPQQAPRGGRERDPKPIAERIGADEKHAGRGIVTAFIDSGFYDHPDLVTPHSRIHAYFDVINDKGGVEHIRKPEVSSWHGMMSTVVAAGNGSLSQGRFKSLAPEMGLVLVKAGTLQRVHHDDIARAIEWVLVNRARYDIRILNISCGGDYEVSHLHDPLSRFAEACVRAGIVVVCAVGNSGHRPGYVVPPASVPCVISVGGIDDEGNPELGRIMAYRSSYGPTIDGVQKPEIVTLADWIPAPILPHTPTAKQAKLFRRLELSRDDELAQIISENLGIVPALDDARERQPYLIRQIVTAGLHDEKVIDEHYKMVDGTSFSAPIVSSVVAQMLEANPKLTPSEVKRILIRTARRVPDISVDRQGWGAVQPKAAVEAALQR